MKLPVTHMAVHEPPAEAAGGRLVHTRAWPGPRERERERERKGEEERERGKGKGERERQEPPEREPGLGCRANACGAADV